MLSATRTIESPPPCSATFPTTLFSNEKEEWLLHLWPSCRRQQACGNQAHRSHAPGGRRAVGLQSSRSQCSSTLATRCAHPMPEHCAFLCGAPGATF
jgi:hypothetical protein